MSAYPYLYCSLKLFAMSHII